jgi:Cu-Zn family superoxide dismutase
MLRLSQTNLTNLCLSLALLAVVACGSKEPAYETAAPAPEPAAAPAPVVHVAEATLQGREGSGVSGVVTFTQSEDSVEVTAHVSGVSAGTGEHGFHIHEVGDCSAPDFTSAGGHFNPTENIHGGPDDAERHAGDLGNITVDETGHGTLTRTSNLITVTPGANSVVGRAVILHEKQDDLVSQPTGDAGGRIACGVVVETAG